MKAILILVWMTSQGQLGGMPWESFPTDAACDKRAADMRKWPVSPDKKIFFVGCVGPETPFIMGTEPK
jgi:hypothetical protein